MSKISIIIPVLNEQATIVKVLLALQKLRQNGHEIIIVDGGSSDNTIALSKEHSDLILHTTPGRAKQMNLGAVHSNNDILLFLHADTYLPEFAESIILKSLDDKTHWGRFNIKFSNHRLPYRIIARMINLRSKLTGIATGDQAIYMCKKTFDRIKGYPDILLMEDIAITKKLKKNYNCAKLTVAVTTSSRRWETNGILRVIFMMWLLRTLYFIGVDPNYLYKIYYG